MPLPIIHDMDRNTAEQIESLVDKITLIKKDNPQEDTTPYEREIDELVYKLYELTDKEIEIDIRKR